MLSRILGRRPPSDEVALEPSVTEVESSHRALVLREIASKLEFQMLSVDGLSWIDPFSGEAVSAPFGHVDPAVERLMALRPWERQLRPKPMADLLRIRWVLHLRTHGDDEPRLRLMDRAGNWLNPFTGKMHKLPDDVRKPGRLVEAIAEILAATPEAAKGAMKSKVELDAILDRARPAQVVGVSEIQISATKLQGTGITRRTSGDGVPGPATPAQAGTGDSDIDKAKALMEGILPRPPGLPGYTIGIHYEPHAHLGGDFFDFIEHVPGRWLILLGDVSGHGVQGALAAVAALKSLRLLARFHAELGDLMTVWNEEIRKDLPKGHFISAHLVELDVARHEVRVLCCGAHPLVRLNAASANPLARLGQNGPALGLLPAAAFRTALRPATYVIEPGDALVAYTDGLSEAGEGKRGEFGHHRVLGSLLSHSADGSNGMLDGVVADLRAWSQDAIDDDLSILSLGRTAEA
jgi:hypothetical protein